VKPARLVAIFAAALLVIGTYLLSEALFVWDAALLLAVSITALAVAGLWRTGPGRLRSGAWARPVVPHSPRDAMRAIALALSGFAALMGRSWPPTEGFGVVLTLWGLALLLFLLTLVGAGSGHPSTGWLLSTQERRGLVGLVIVAFLLRGVAVGRVPASLGGDEGTQLAAALDLVARPLGNPFATGWYSVPTLSFVIYGVAMRLFGATVAGGRMVSVVIGTATVLTTFWFARATAGRLVGWIAAVMLAFSAYHIHFSRLASNQIADPLIGTLVLLLVVRAMAGGPNQSGPGSAWTRWVHRHGVITERADGLWGLAGVVAGLGWYLYFGARWVTAIAILVVVWRCLSDRTLWQRHRRGFALFFAGWLVVALPLLGWYAAHPSAFTERYNAVGLFASGWMDRERLLTGRPTGSLLLQQIWRSITAFHLTRDPTFWYRPNRPLVDFVTGALMLVGIIEAFVRVRWPSRVVTHLWFWPTIAMAWVMTENPPSSQRGLLLMPPVVIYAAWGAERLATTLAASRRCKAIVVALLLAPIAAMNVAFYFGVYSPTEVYGNPSAQTATRFAAYMKANPEPVCEVGRPIACRGTVYFLGPPWLYWSFGSLSFLLR
jgi:4-amino-4-deoxy-L-arabinose transferase-like glycosyltransferase